MMKLLIASLLLLLTIGCHSPKNTGKQRVELPSAITGSFTDDYGSTYKISNSNWQQDKSAVYHIILFNSKENYIIARNDKANPSDGNLYSRIDIMYFENMGEWKWGFCLTTYNAKTAEEAIQSATPDRTNPKKGCNGYPFTRMQRK